MRCNTNQDVRIIQLFYMAGPPWASYDVFNKRDILAIKEGYAAHVSAVDNFDSLEE